MTAQWHGLNLTDPSMGLPLNSRALHRLFRSTCDDCSGTRLRWLSADDLLHAVPDEQVGDVHELIRLAEGDVEEAWLCRSCGNFGVMGRWAMPA